MRLPYAKVIIMLKLNRRISPEKSLIQADCKATVYSQYPVGSDSFELGDGTVNLMPVVDESSIGHQMEAMQNEAL
jgi:hypothetical protein